jgi:two-component system response regulator HydG
MCPSKNNSDSPDNPASSIRVLLVDNNKSHALTMEETLERVGYNCCVATSGPEGARRIEQDNFDVVITDLVMNDVDGMEILNRARQSLPECEVIVVTGHASVPKAVEAMQRGAFNFLEKPLNTDRLRAITEKAADAVRLKQANVDLQKRLDEKFGFEGIIYASDKIQAVIDRLKRIAPTDATVLITGDTGTGKELVAQAIHQNSPRKKKPFVALNCAALSEHLLESELFGHVRGAYTDASADRMGRFEYAHGGTLFLDEVGDLPLDVQPKLLRFLEQGEVLPVGDTRPQRVDVRVVAATNADLEQRVVDGKFREDLFYRLSVIRMHVPPLRERREEIPHLTTFFLREASERLGKPGVRLSQETLDLFDSFQWPGNVRQLRNEVQRAVAMAPPGGLVTPDLLSAVFAADSPVSDSGGRPRPRRMTLGAAVDKLEREMIEAALERAAGNVSETARVLGLTRRGLYLKMQRLKVAAI